jgi:pimeloyl-ACP methyl ester carboxylesterase
VTSLRRLRRAAAAVTALLAFVLLAGTTYQGVATALERHRFARPGGLVDAGGHQLHIYCTGKGSPMVVLEAAAGSMSAAWAWIQPEVARTTRVCSYDRAGLGWSEAGDGLYVISRAPEELRVLLDRANETGPVVLVGHELGALFARLYAARFEGSTAALVLIDDPIQSRGAVAPAFASAWPWLARVGAVRTSGKLPALATGLPGDAGGAMRAFLNRPDHLTRAAMEIAHLGEVESAARDQSLSPKIIVTSVAIGVETQPAMLVTQTDAAQVTRAIEATVAQVREGAASAATDK